MRLREFVRKNRKEIDEVIRAVLKDPGAKVNDTEREQWIINHEGLYYWARSEGVPV